MVERRIKQTKKKRNFLTDALVLGHSQAHGYWVRAVIVLLAAEQCCGGGRGDDGNVNKHTRRKDGKTKRKTRRN